MAIDKTKFYFQSLNQFAPNRVRGEELDWGLNAQVVEVEADASVATPIWPGDAVKIVATSTGKLKVAAAEAGDAVYGYALYNPKKQNYAAHDKFSVLRDGGAISEVTEEAIDAGTTVYFKVEDGSVTTTAAGNILLGIALAKVPAVAEGTLIPVEVVKAPLA